MIDERYMMLLPIILTLIGVTIVFFYDRKQEWESEKKSKRKLYLMRNRDLDKLKREFGGDHSIDFPFWTEQKRRKEQMEIATRKWFGEDKE